MYHLCNSSVRIHEAQTEFRHIYSYEGRDFALESLIDYIRSVARTSLHVTLVDVSSFLESIHGSNLTRPKLIYIYIHTHTGQIQTQTRFQI